MRNNFDFKVKMFGQMEVTVIADNEKEAKRILEETIEGITVKDIKEKLSKCNEVEIKKSDFINQITRPERNMER